jgi:hypothetical protein
MRSILASALVLLGVVTLAPGCGSDDADGGSGAATSSGSGGSGATGAQGSGAQGSGAQGSGAGGQGQGGGPGGGGGQGGVPDPGPNVDTSEHKLYSFSFTPDEADAAADARLGNQRAFLDTQVEPRGKLVVYLHGAGDPSTCGSQAHGELLAGMGYHFFAPCYFSNYGVSNCGDDIEGCRLEAFEGVDHHALVDVTPANSTETRVAKALTFLAGENPQGDWTYYLDGDVPRWNRIIVTGISHGASSSGVVGLHRLVHRSVMLSGPLDTDQAWLKKPTMTPLSRFFGFTHTGDDQHPGHLQAFEDMGLPGDPVIVDEEAAPYGGSHRLVSSAPTSNGHSSTEAGGASPEEGGEHLFLPVWQTMYLDE